MSHSRHSLPASTSAGVGIQSAVLAVAAALAWSCAAEIPHRLEAVGFAAAVCLGGIAGAWAAASWRGSTPAARVSATLAVVGLRIFPALAALGWLQTHAGLRLREAGAGGALVACYLSVLAADVFLNIIGSGESSRAPVRKRVN